MDEQEEVMSVHRPRKLDFNVPLLSTRRPGGFTSVEICRTNSQGTFQARDDRVPFSWEQAPGKPKDLQTSDTHDVALIPPKLPPSRWHLSKEAIDNEEGCNQHHYQDDGCDGDVDDDDNDDTDDVFSDAIDMFSLSDSMENIGETETGKLVRGLNGINLKVAESSGDPSPDFIIQRFLPAATALAAASSALTVSKNLDKKLAHSSNYPERCISRAVGQSYSSGWGCGFEGFFSSRMRHKLCGVKSPVRRDSSKVKPQWSTRQKQYCLSAERYL